MAGALCADRSSDTSSEEVRMDRDRFDEAQRLAWERILREVRRLKDGGMTLEQIADMLGVPHRAKISLWLRGGQKAENATFSNMCRYLAALGIDPREYIPAGEGAPKVLRQPSAADAGELATVNVYQAAAAGQPIDLREYEPLFSIQAPAECLRGSDFSLEVKGHSMEPLIPDDSLVGVKTDFRFLANELYAAWIPYEGLVVKRVGVDHATKEFVFKSQNPDKESYPDFRIPIGSAEKVIMGKIVWILIRY